MSAGLIIALITALFLGFAIASGRTIAENGRLRQALSLQERLAEKALSEKKAVEKNYAQLKGEIEAFGKQKALYIATIETLMKKDSPSR